LNYDSDLEYPDPYVAISDALITQPNPRGLINIFKILRYIHIVKQITGYNDEDIYLAYCLKNERNLKRAKYIREQPGYDFKSDETKLCLDK
jgi:hypothetical protein